MVCETACSMDTSRAPANSYFPWLIVARMWIRLGVHIISVTYAEATLDLCSPDWGQNYLGVDREQSMSPVTKGAVAKLRWLLWDYDLGHDSWFTILCWNQAVTDDCGRSKIPECCAWIKWIVVTEANGGFGSTWMFTYLCLVTPYLVLLAACYGNLNTNRAFQRNAFNGISTRVQSVNPCDWIKLLNIIH